MKRDGRTLDHATLEEFRLLALRRVGEGEKPVRSGEVAGDESHSPRSVTHSSLPLRVNVGSWGSRPSRMPLERRSGLVVGPAAGLGVLPITRFSTASIK